MKLVFIRHGLTRSNEYNKYIGGKTEESLSEKGRYKILEAKAAGKYPSAQLVASSSMSRCLETAELIYEKKPSIVIDEWREIDFGSFEGKSHQELSGDIYYKKWIESGGTLPFPRGESRKEFTERCSRGFIEFLRQTAETGNRVDSAAAIVHGGTIMAILSTFGEGEYYDFQCKNGEGFFFEICEKDYEELCQKQNEEFYRQNYGELHVGFQEEIKENKGLHEKESEEFHEKENKELHKKANEEPHKKNEVRKKIIKNIQKL